MPWLSRVNFVSSDTLSFTDINNLGNDIRAWGDNVNGGGYTLSNVVISASAGTMATVTGGAGAASTLTLRSTSGAGTTDAIVFQTGSQAEAMRIASSRNVGIGTATPAARLHILTNQPTAANEVARFQGGNNSSNFRNYISCYTTNANFWWELSNEDSAGTGSSNGFAFRERSAADPSVVRLYLASGGNVGIGTASPSNKLTVLTTGTLNTVGDTIDAGATFTGADYAFGTGGNPAILNVHSNSTLGAGVGATIGLGGRYTGTSFSQFAIIKGAKENATDGNFATFLAFGTRANGGNITERMRIDSSGNVGIGTTGPAYRLQLSTDSAAKPSTNTWTIASDARLKIVLGDYEKGLDAICALRPVRYHYNGLGGMVADGKEHISIVAQEAQEVFPECIGTFQGKLHGDDEEDTQLLNYNGHAVTFALINAIRELKARLDALA